MRLQRRQCDVTEPRMRLQRRQCRLYSSRVELRLTIPDSVAQALGPEPQREALEALLAELVFQARISTDDAGAVLGLTPAESIEWYSNRGHDYVAYPPDELTEEIESLRRATRRRRGRG